MPGNLHQVAVEAFALNYDEPDGQQILRFMGELVAARQREPYIREMAVALLRGVRDNDIREQARRLTNFVKQKVIYVRDPVGSEYIIDPVNMLLDIQRKGEARGDCDDHVALLASLLGAVGIPAEPMAVKLGAPVFNHVIVRARIGGQWEEIDPCAKRGGQPQYAETLTLDQVQVMNRNPETLSAFGDWFDWVELAVNTGVGIYQVVDGGGSGNGGSTPIIYGNQGIQAPAADPLEKYMPLLIVGGLGIGVLVLVSAMKK